MLAAVATALLIGPVAYHRFVFRQRQKEHLVKTANALAIAGLAAVALAVSGAVLLISSYVIKGFPGVLVGVGTGCLFAALWFVFPLARRESSDRQSHRPLRPDSLDWDSWLRLLGMPNAESSAPLPALAAVGLRRRYRA